ncbi:hypothetical protein GCM10010429_23040 [Micromonospora olivasterospora]
MAVMGPDALYLSYCSARATKRLLSVTWQGVDVPDSVRKGSGERGGGLPLSRETPRSPPLGGGAPTALPPTADEDEDITPTWDRHPLVLRHSTFRIHSVATRHRDISALVRHLIPLVKHEIAPPNAKDSSGWCVALG